MNEMKPECSVQQQKKQRKPRDFSLPHSWFVVISKLEEFVAPILVTGVLTGFIEGATITGMIVLAVVAKVEILQIM
jgi:hypothetical protein